MYSLYEGKTGGLCQYYHQCHAGLLVTVDYDLNIVQLNKAANDLFDITRKKHLLGKQVDEIMDDYAR